MAQLRNREARMRVLELEELGHDKHIIGVNDRDASHGIVGHRKIEKMLPRTITLCARGTEGDTSEVLPDAVLRNKLVAELIKGRKIENIAPAIAPTAPAEPEPTDPPSAA